MSSSQWKKIEQLVGDQQYEAASKLVMQRLEAAKKAGDQTEWTRALIREVQLRVGLHGYETAVRFLIDEKWPQGAIHRAALQLFYAQTLRTYLQAYSYEIRQRERVDTKGPIDLKAWTADQIAAEANRAYATVWKDREALDSPVTVLSEYVEPNDYPQGIRSTLRDAVSDLWAAQLTDTSLWRPEQENATYQLDLHALIAGEALSQAQLEDPAVHPARKLAAVLGDLERWHAQHGNKEAALEAFLERLRRLNGLFTREEDQAVIREAMAKRVHEDAALPWSAMGQATLAELWNDAGDGVKAHDLALAGARAFPKSPGGLRCENLAKNIEEPGVTVLAMREDGPHRRSVLLTHKNVGRVYLRAYRLDVDQLVSQWKDYNLYPANDEQLLKITQGKPAAEWTQQLPATPDFKQHQTYVTPPLDRPGLYLIVTSLNPGFTHEHNLIQAVYLHLTQVVLAVRGMEQGGAELRVFDGETGRPATGATIELYKFDWQHGHQKLWSKPVNAHGELTVEPSSELSGGSYFVIARWQGQLALGTQPLSFYAPHEEPETKATLVYTDRAIYRPGQKVLWKVVTYAGRSEAAQYQVQPGAKVQVKLTDANGQEVESKEVTTNAFGSAAGEFVVPPGRLLGAWSVNATPNGSARVQVEEYKRPTFEVTFKDVQAAMRLNQPVKLTGQARYYFGLPVTSAKVRWSVSRQPVYPFWWGWFGFPRQATEIIASGTSSLRDDGTFDVPFTAKEDPRTRDDKAITYGYQVSADVTDEGGETRSAQRTVHLGWVAVEAQIAQDTGFFREGQPASLQITRTDLDGAPKAGNASWTVVALAQPAQASTPADLPVVKPKDAKAVVTEGDTLYARWHTDTNPDALMREWKDGAQQGSGTLQHDGQGRATVRLPKLAPGAYRLRYRTQDEFGAIYETQKEFVVAGEKTRISLPLALWVDQSSVKVGQTLRALVVSGLPDQPLAVDIVRQGKPRERRYLIAARDPSLIEIPVQASDRGGISISVVAVRDWQFMSASQNVTVPFDDKQLQVEFSTFRDKIRPGAKETWRITVRSPDGKALEQGAAEILASMYDRSLDAFVSFDRPDLNDLYPQRIRGTFHTTSLGQEYGHLLINADLSGAPDYPHFQGDRLKFEEGYPIGGPGGRRFGVRMRSMQSRAYSVGAAPPSPSAAAPMAKKARELEAPPEAGRAEPPAAKKGGGGEAQNAPVPLRQNFAETAFWSPQLITGPDGSASFEFTVPDSVTSWKVWAQAITRDLRGGAVEKETRSVKEVLVRPYLPRFMREGDQAVLKVVVNNASDHAFDADVTFALKDAETGKSLLDAFGVPAAEQKPRRVHVDAGKGANLSYTLKVPPRLGTVSVQVEARAGQFSDGELRAIPVLPGRVHLSQSRFVTLREGKPRTMTFEDLQKPDPTRINGPLVVTVDAQLFYSVLSALPYLVNYPYECTEQTLNRFVSTGIVSSLYGQYPAVARMAKELSKRKTPLEQWAEPDPNRKMALEESPWVVEAKGGEQPPSGLINVLDPQIATAQREESLSKLRKAQTSLGAFPWFPGGPPSPYMTLYIVNGLSRALEYKVDVPKELLQHAWSYLATHFRDEYVGKLKAGKDVDYEFVTFLNYVASRYPDESWTGSALTADERKLMLDYSFKHWRNHSPYLKGLLALTLHRMGRDKDAHLVWKSVMDSAKTTEDEGTFWAPEDRSWLWYNDTTESQAFALRVLMELSPKDSRREGLVQWLLLDKKLSQWKSTRATAEAVYSLVKYLEAEGALGVSEQVTAKAGPYSHTWTFEPDQYTGKKNQLAIDGPLVNASTSKIEVSKEGKGLAFASATWQFSTEQLPSEERGDFFTVSRRYFKREKRGNEVTLTPLSDGAVLQPGDELEVQLSLKTKHAAEFVHLRDPRGAGFEPESATSKYQWQLGVGYYEEVRDSGTNFFFDWLPVGEFTFKYRVRANLAGAFRVGPATVQSMYAPEFNAYSAGALLKVEGEAR